MSSTTVLEKLPKMAEAATREFGERKPSNAELARFLAKKYPKMDGGLSIGIAAAALILQAWSAYQVEQDRWEKIHCGNCCPRCSKPAIKITRAGKYKCKNGHTWSKK